MKPLYDCATFAALLGENGQRALSRASSLTRDLAGLSTLRKEFPPALATLAHLTLELREKAAGRFTRADAMYFLPEALEQATGEAVARHKAKRFEATPRVFDLGCGIGGDTLALASATQVVASDRDALRLVMARANATAYGVHDRVDFVQGDIETMPPAPGATIHLDPARRSGGRRQRNADAFSPGVDVLRSLKDRCPDGAYCLGPATAERDVQALVGASHDPSEVPAEVELISLDGECKALTVWTGAFRTAIRRATLLPSGETLVGDGRLGGPVAHGGTRGFVAVPDPAVTRAHLVGALSTRLEAPFVATHGALLTVEAPPPGPAWVRCYPVRADFAYTKARLRSELRARAIENPIVSIQGLPIEARGIPGTDGRGAPDGRVFLIRTDDGTRAIITGLRAETSDAVEEGTT